MMLLPTTFPSATSDDPCIAEDTLTASSGVDVPNATIVNPITIELIFILFATVGFVQAQVGSSTPAIETLLNESAALWGTHVSKHKPLEQLGKFKKGVMSLWQPYTDLNGSALIKRYAQAN